MLLVIMVMIVHVETIGFLSARFSSILIVFSMFINIITKAAAKSATKSATKCTAEASWSIGSVDSVLDFLGGFWVLFWHSHGKAIALRADNLSFVEIGTRTSTSLNTVVSSFKLLNIFCFVQVLRFAEGYVTQEEQFAFVARGIL